MTPHGLSRSHGVLREARSQGGARSGSRVVEGRSAFGLRKAVRALCEGAQSWRPVLALKGNRFHGVKLLAALGAGGGHMFWGEQGGKCGAFGGVPLARTRAPRAAPARVANRAWEMPEPGDQRPLGGRGEARHGVLALGGHPPSRAFPASREGPAGPRARVRPRVVTVPCPLLCTDTLTWNKPSLSGVAPLPRSLHSATTIGNK